MRKQVKNRTINFETLERRELMFGDTVAITFSPASGALNIQGSAADEAVRLVSNGNNMTEVYVNNTRSNLRVGGSVQTSIPTNSIKSINADLKGGRDAFLAEGWNANALNPNRVDINLGTGVQQEVKVDFGVVKNLNIDASRSTATYVLVANTNVTDRVFLDMGSDRNVSNDIIDISDQDLNNLTVRAGGGDDNLRIRNTAIRKVEVDMGAGKDNVIDWGNNNIRSGVFNGGSGGEDYLPDSLRRRVKVLNFERK